MASAADHNATIIRQFTRWARPFGQLPLHSESAVMDRTLAAIAPAPGMEVLDVACGPGILACAIAAKGARVTGIDLTPAMIGEARARQQRGGLEGMEWHVGDAMSLPFPDARFDCVTTRYSFHHIRQPAAVFAEMARVCRPGGRIVVIDATPSPETQQAYDRMETVRDPSHASALTLDQLRAIGRDAGYAELVVDSFRLEALLSALSDPETADRLTAMFEADIDADTDRFGVGPWRGPDGICFHFPGSVVAWRR